MFVSIIIVNYNGLKFLKDCLSSINSITYPDYEVILVDNHSSDESVDFVKKNFPDVRIKQLEQNFGFAKANNIGAGIARGDLLLFLNNDTEVTEGFLEPLVSGIKPDNIAICQSLLLKPTGEVDSAGDFIDKYGRAFSSKIIPNDTSPILSARGACMLVKKEIFLQFGGFDEKFFASFEDVDLGWRIWLLGYKVLSVPKSIVYHYGGRTISTMREKIKFHGAKNTLIIRMTNFEIQFLIKSISILFIATIFRRLFGIAVIKDPEISPPLPSIKIIFKSFLWVLKNYNYIKTKRAYISKNRKYSTKNLIKLNLITSN